MKTETTSGENCLPPSKIEFGTSWFTHENRAKCKQCNFVSAYWECGCELEHDCDEYQGEK